MCDCGLNIECEKITIYWKFYFTNSFLHQFPKTGVIFESDYDVTWNKKLLICLVSSLIYDLWTTHDIPFDVCLHLIMFATQIYSSKKYSYKWWLILVKHVYHLQTHEGKKETPVDDHVIDKLQLTNKPICTS